MNTTIAIYLIIGASIWLLIDWCGLVEQTCRSRQMRGLPPTGLALALAAAMIVIGWPMLFYCVAAALRADRGRS